ncbi:hypothetical protein TNCV_567421 [Trichonephila clavipes]|nr:hypothetical protein TNCV_567421 [Trichonephila clavipes]
MGIVRKGTFILHVCHLNIVSSLLTIDRAAMPVVSDPCSCQSDCFVCGRGEEPPMIVPCTFCWNRWCFKNECCMANPPKQKIGGNFKKWKRIFTPGHADDGRK